MKNFANIISLNSRSHTDIGSKVTSPRTSHRLKVKMGLASLENKFKMRKLSAFNNVKFMSLQNKYQRFSFCLGKTSRSARQTRTLVDKDSVKNTLKLLIKNFESKIKIGYLKLKLNRMKKRSSNSVKESNHLVALAMCTKALLESRLRGSFRFLKYNYLAQNEAIKANKAGGMHLESTLIPYSSECKSNFSSTYQCGKKGTNFFIKPNSISQVHHSIRKSKSKEKSLICQGRIYQRKKKSSSKSISIKSEQIKRDSISSNFNFERRSRRENETRVKKSVRMVRGLCLLSKFEKRRCNEAIGYLPNNFLIKIFKNKNFIFSKINKI